MNVPRPYAESSRYVTTWKMLLRSGGFRACEILHARGCSNTYVQLTPILSVALNLQNYGMKFFHITARVATGEVARGLLFSRDVFAIKFEQQTIIAASTSR